MKDAFSPPRKAAATVWNQLDVIDKRLSLPFFTTKVPFVVECLLSIPGNWFGLPPLTLMLAPSLTAIYFETNPNMAHGWKFLVYFVLLVFLGVWALVFQGNKRAIRILYGPLLGGFVAPLLGVALLSWRELTFPSNGVQVGYFQVAAWALGVLPVAILKPLIGRQRPAYWCQQENDSVYMADQHHSADSVLVLAAFQNKGILPKLFRRDGRSSFPSGDTAGAMAVVYPLLRCGGGSGQVLAMSCLILSCFGRMYFLAHHMGDVLAGIVVAVPCCWLLEYVVVLMRPMEREEQSTASRQECPCRAEWWHALSAVALLLSTVILSRLWSKTEVFQSGTIRTASLSTPRNKEDNNKKG
jgi:membrane-associated phospholipid phosphatase